MTTRGKSLPCRERPVVTDCYFSPNYIQRVSNNVRDRDRGHALAQRTLSRVPSKQFPIFNGDCLHITDPVPFFNDEGGITQQQTEVNHEVSVGIVMA